MTTVTCKRCEKQVSINECWCIVDTHTKIRQYECKSGCPFSKANEKKMARKRAEENKDDDLFEAHCLSCRECAVALESKANRIKYLNKVSKTGTSSSSTCKILANYIITHGIEFEDNI